MEKTRASGHVFLDFEEISDDTNGEDEQDINKTKGLLSMFLSNHIVRQLFLKQFIVLFEGMQPKTLKNYDFKPKTLSKPQTLYSY